MASELTEFAALAAENILRERDNEAQQTYIDDWAERLEIQQALTEMLPEIDIPSEPRRQVDVVSFGNHAVLGFVSKRGPADERMIFS